MKFVCVIDDEDHFLNMQTKMLEADDVEVKAFNKIGLFFDYIERDNVDINEFDLIVMDRTFTHENVDTVEQKTALHLKSLNIEDGKHGLIKPIFLWTASKIAPSTAMTAGFDQVIDKDVYELEELCRLAVKP